MMKIDPFGTANALKRLDDTAQNGFIGFVHQMTHRLTEEHGSGPENVDRYSAGRESVENHPASEPCEYQPGNYTGARGHVGEQVFAVSRESERASTRASADQEQTEHGVHHR